MRRKAFELEAHLRECKGCEQAFEVDRAVKKVVSNPVLVQSVPDEFRRRMFAGLAQQAAPPLNRRQISWRFLGLAASVAIVFGLVWLLPERGLDGRDVLAAHLRSLQTDGHLMDVASTDQHTVKPWFDGKLDFAPAVRDLATQGFPLVGGRLDYLHDRPVAALVYRRNKHVINLFIWPGVSGEGNAEKQGYNLVHWSDGEMTYWAVSDLNMSELESFSNLFRAGGK